MNTLRKTIERFLGMLRSILMYYAIPFRGRRLRRFYRFFTRPEGLCFDIGANVGNRTKALSRIGARVISVEPQPHFARLLERIFRNDENVTILDVAVGAEIGTTTLYLNERHPTLATTRSEWIEQVRSNTRFAGEQWEGEISVEQTTLDALVADYGVPDFVKIDVEGGELAVLAGLSTALPALSFEFVPASENLSYSCLETIESLGEYRYNLSFVERMRFAEPRWVTAGEIATRLAAMPLDGHSGDIYAVRIDVLSSLPMEA